MPLLARHIRTPAIWAEVDEDASWVANDFPFAALSELSEARSKGLSCYEVARRSDRILFRLAAALFLGSNSSDLKPMQFRFVNTERFAAINIQKTDGKLPDKELNSRHYDLTGVTGPTAIELVQHMKGKLQVVTEDQIIREIVRGLRAGRLAMVDVKENVLKILGRHLVRKSLPKKPAIHIDKQALATSAQPGKSGT
jgi:hypothetical protein